MSPLCVTSALYGVLCSPEVLISYISVHVCKHIIKVGYLLGYMSIASRTDTVLQRVVWDVRLCWLVEKEIDRKEQVSDYKIHTHDVSITTSALAFCKDQHSNLHELRHYFSESVWYNAEESRCALCNRRSGYSTSCNVKWVQCNRCFVWLQQQCACLTRKPKGR